MRRKTCIVTATALGLVILLTACAPAGNQGAATFDKDAIAQKIEVASKAKTAAMVAEDIDTYLSYFTKDAVWMPPNTDEILGQAAARQRIEHVFKLVSIEGKTEIQEQVVMSPDWASERGQYVVTMSPKEGAGKPVEEVGSYLTIWHKTDDGKWKVAYDIWNSDRGPSLVKRTSGK